MPKTLHFKTHTIVIFHQVVVASLVFVFFVIVHQSGACAVPNPRLTRLGRNDGVVFVVRRLGVVNGLLGLSSPKAFVSRMEVAWLSGSGIPCEKGCCQ